MAKLLITSDINFGYVLSPYGINDEDRLNTLKKLIILGKKHDALIIAGHLFHSKSLDFNKYVEKITNLFNILNQYDTKIIYLPYYDEYNQGIVDILENKNISNLYIFKKSTPLEINFFNTIYSFIPIDNFENINLSKKIPNTNSDSNFKIGISINENNTANNPLKRIQQLDEFLDFYVFGNNPFLKIFKLRNKIVAVNSSSPESQNENEYGVRYALSVNIYNNSIADIKRLPINTRTAERLCLNCSDYNSFDEIITIIKQKYLQKINILLILEGHRSFKITQTDSDSLKNHFHFFNLVDNSIPNLDTIVAENEKDESLRGDIIREIHKRFQEDKSVDEKILCSLLNNIDNHHNMSPEEWLCSLITL